MKKYYDFVNENVNAVKEKELIHIIISKFETNYTLLRVDELIKKDFDVNYIERGFYGYTLLMQCGLKEKIKIAKKLLEHPDINVFIKSKQGHYFIEYFSDKRSFIDYNLQKTIILNNPKNIKLFFMFDIVHPDIIKEYPHLGTGHDLNLL